MDGAKFAIQCPNCQKRYIVAGQAAGKRVKCPRCATVFVASAAAPAAKTAAPKPRPETATKAVAQAPVARTPNRPEPSRKPTSPALDDLFADAFAQNGSGGDPLAGSSLKRAAPKKSQRKLILGIGIAGGAIVALLMSVLVARAVLQTQATALNSEFAASSHTGPPAAQPASASLPAESPPAASPSSALTVVNRVTDHAHNFSIVPPRGWHIGPSIPPNFLTCFGEAHSAIRSNLGVNEMPDDGVPIERAVEQIKQGMPKLFNEWKYTGSEMVTINGLPGYSLSSTFRQGDYQLHFCNTEFAVTTGASSQSRLRLWRANLLSWKRPFGNRR